LLFSSITYTGLVSYSFNLSPSSLKTSQDPIQWNIIYGKPFPRIGTFLIGLIFGFVFLELSQKQQGRKSRAFEFQRFEFFFKRVILNDRFFQIFCLVGGFFLTGIIAGPFYLQYYGEESLSGGFKAVWLALQRPVFGAFVGVFILFMAFGYLKLVRRFLSMRIFQYFSKISFCFYLVHPISFAVVNSDEIIDWSIFVVVSRSVYCFFISVFIALACEIFIQMPLVGLGERLLVGKFRK
jgi:peptidoglycan/LPS O-acetylase OafA/YrhL